MSAFVIFGYSVKFWSPGYKLFFLPVSFSILNFAITLTTSLDLIYCIMNLWSFSKKTYEYEYCNCPWNKFSPKSAWFHWKLNTTSGEVMISILPVWLNIQTICGCALWQHVAYLVKYVLFGRSLVELVTHSRLLESEYSIW